MQYESITTLQAQLGDMADYLRDKGKFENLPRGKRQRLYRAEDLVTGAIETLDDFRWKMWPERAEADYQKENEKEVDTSIPEEALEIDYNPGPDQSLDTASIVSAGNPFGPVDQEVELRRWAVTVSRPHIVMAERIKEAEKLVSFVKGETNDR